MFSGWLKRRLVLWLLFAWAVTGPGFAGPGPNAATLKDPVRINFACASEEVFGSAGIQGVAREQRDQQGDDIPGIWGDRAVALDLNHDRQPEYLVPLSCGATCNCSWAIIAAKPARSLGVVQGCVLDLSLARRGWAQVTTYNHVSAGEGTLTTYDFKNGKYVKQGEWDLRPEVVESYERCKDNESCCP